MPIGSNGALYIQRFHPTDGEKGFHPYTVAIKNNGVYIEGDAGALLHISLHHHPEKKDNSISQCHLTIPKEIESRINKHGFKSRQYFKWFRTRGLSSQYHRAALLIFPTIFANEKFAVSEKNEVSLTIIPLVESASIIEFWYTGADENEFRKYLEGFGNPLHITTLPNGEKVGINYVQENTRDYSTYQKTDDFGSYRLVGENDTPDEEFSRISIGPYGQHCYGILHGKPEPV